jgi:hypothetical protein
MKTGKSIVELAQEIERQAAAKKDYVADTRKLQMVVPDGGGVKLSLMNGARTEFAIGPTAHRQIGDRLGVPAKYYDRMLSENQSLLATNVNTWFNQTPEKRLVRTLDGQARAFLSDRYQRIDNVEVAQVVLPELLGARDLEIVSTEVTESRLYIKVISHAVKARVNSLRARRDPQVGDVVEAGAMITNSEVGLGALAVTPFFHYLWCKNGAVRNKEGVRQHHVGTRLDADDNIAGLLADDTRAVLDRGVLLKVRDVVRNAISQVALDKAIDLMNAQTEQRIEGNPAQAIEVLANEFAIGQAERSSILRHLIEGADLSRYGLMQAVTRTAEDLPSYDRATEFEAMGGRVLDLNAASWRAIATAE